MGFPKKSPSYRFRSSTTIARLGYPAFTLVELLVSLTILTIILLLLVGITNQTSSIWRRTTAKVEQFRDARAAFEAMTTRLGQATLNTYWDYDNALTPTKYLRQSELRFISGPASTLLASTPTANSASTHSVFFQAPFGVTTTPSPLNANGKKYDGYENLLCSWGYYLNYDSDLAYRPPFFTASILPLRYRFRLMELWQPAERNEIYDHTTNGQASIYHGREWFTDSIAASPPQTHVLAENVVALILTPRLPQQDEADIKGAITSANADLSPLAPNYLYDTSPPPGGTTADSRYSDPRLNPMNQLPPLIQVTMVAIDENSAARMNFSASSRDPFSLQSLFQNTSNLTADRATLEATLISQKLNYRVFSTSVMIRGAKWSRATKN